MARRPTPKEHKALIYFMAQHIEDPGNFPGIGKVGWAEMVAEGWVVWVSSPETNEEGYMITDAGLGARSQIPQTRERRRL